MSGHTQLDALSVSDEDSVLKTSPTAVVSFAIISLVLATLWLVAAKTHDAKALSPDRIWIVD